MFEIMYNFHLANDNLDKAPTTKKSMSSHAVTVVAPQPAKRYEDSETSSQYLSVCPLCHKQLAGRPSKKYCTGLTERSLQSMLKSARGNLISFYHSVSSNVFS